jgi:3-hydroxy-3-methylglutaryl CoA synthase
LRGIISAAGYLPHWRLQGSVVADVLGGAPSKGTRTVASYDEDGLTMAVDAGRRALAAVPSVRPSTLWFSTTSPTYVEKTNATIAHAALRLDPDVLAADAAAGLRGTAAALRSALRSTEPAVLVLAGDVRTGPAGSAEERDGGDAGAALLIGDDDGGDRLVAEYLGGASATREFLDRWRSPGDLRTRSWEERFGEQRYAALAGQAWDAGLKDAGLDEDGRRASRSPVRMVAPPPVCPRSSAPSVSMSPTPSPRPSASAERRTLRCCSPRWSNRRNRVRSWHWCRSRTEPTRSSSVSRTGRPAAGRSRPRCRSPINSVMATIP